jgi:phage gp36-like protein
MVGPPFPLERPGMPYLSVSEYISRFGERETILLTNTTPPSAGSVPTYDSVKVETAIIDAQEVVDGYVGRRYATPIDDAPRIVKGWIAALARETLHVNTGKTNDAVAKAADLARSQLREVAKGDMTLPIAEGQPAPTEKGQGFARSSMDRPSTSFTGAALDAFTAPFGIGAEPACWRSGT